MPTDNTPAVPVYTDAVLGDVKSFEDAVALLAESGITLTDITEYTDGFVKAEKDQFVNVPLMVFDYKFMIDKDTKREYVRARIMTKDDEKFAITDGSLGIYEQLKVAYAKGDLGGIMCRKGIGYSDYTHTDENTGEITKARTYRFAL